MLLQVADEKERRWRRDPGIRELIEYFNQEKFLEIPKEIRFRELRKRDRALIEDQAEKCRADFAYATRNFFWIVDEKKQDIPFRLLESQELLLEKAKTLHDRGRPQKLLIVKARRLGCSTLIEGMIAWKTMFFYNTNGLVVSNAKWHAAELFGIMLHIYNHLPWWLQPRTSSLKIEDGLHFENPDRTLVAVDPGLNSHVWVQHAGQESGVGQGVRLSCAHCSEFTDWSPQAFKDIIFGDMVYALSENDPETFAVLESTARGAGTPSEKLWVTMQELLESHGLDYVEWLPVFLGWFFEREHFLSPEGGWKPHTKEVAMREKVERDWVECDNPVCTMLKERKFRDEDRTGRICKQCGIGTYHPLILKDGQLLWWERHRINYERQGEEGLKALLAEQPTTAEEAFQITGVQVFPMDTQNFVNMTVCDPLYAGHLDERGDYHAVAPDPPERELAEDEHHPCLLAGCNEDHRWDLERPLKIWELPEPDARYSIGVDVAEGLGGEHDFSVAWINKVGENMSQDFHVATFRSNTTDCWSFALMLNILGRWYNEAQMAVEYNTYQTVGDVLLNTCQYPNLFRWKHYDAANPMHSSTKLHWITQSNTKPKLWSTAVHWLRQQIWVIRDREFAVEMKRFQKEFDDSKRAEAEEGWKDDVLMASMIALYTVHDVEYSEKYNWKGPTKKDTVASSQDHRMKCMRLTCGHEWFSANPEAEFDCPKCHCRVLTGKREKPLSTGVQFDFDELGRDHSQPDYIPSYEEL